MSTNNRSNYLYPVCNAKEEEEKTQNKTLQNKRISNSIYHL